MSLVSLFLNVEVTSMLITDLNTPTFMKISKIAMASVYRYFFMLTYRASRKAASINGVSIALAIGYLHNVQQR